MSPAYLDMPACSISRCINMCHVSHPVSAGTANPDGILNAAFHVVSFSRLVHPSLVCHLVPPQPVMGTFALESECSWSRCQSVSRSLHHSQCALPRPRLSLGLQILKKKEEVRVRVEILSRRLSNGARGVWKQKPSNVEKQWHHSSREKNSWSDGKNLKANQTSGPIYVCMLWMTYRCASNPRTAP